MVEQQPKLSDAESDVLKMLWQLGPSTVRTLKEALRHDGLVWAHTTVLTLLQRLESKGYVGSDKSGFAHVYSPVVTREKLLRNCVKDLINHYCDGAASPLFQALVKGHPFSAEEIAQFREMLEEMDQPNSHARKKT